MVDRSPEEIQEELRQRLESALTVELLPAEDDEPEEMHRDDDVDQSVH